MSKFKFNGKTYKVENSQLFEVTDTCLLAEHSPSTELGILAHEYGYVLPCGFADSHHYGNQGGQRGRTLAQQALDQGVKFIDVDYAAAEKKVKFSAAGNAKAVPAVDPDDLCTLPIHVFGPDDVFTCPQCGSRVDFDELDSGCFCHCKCGYEFIGETGYDCPQCDSSNTDQEICEDEWTCLDCGFVFVPVDTDDGFEPNAILN